MKPIVRASTPLYQLECDMKLGGVSLFDRLRCDPSMAVPTLAV